MVRAKRIIRYILQRLFLLVISFILFLIIMELGLRFMGLFIDKPKLTNHQPDDEIYILALGDSYTYGVDINRYYSYPSQLERLLNKNSSIKYKVVNLGIPGQNSAQVKKIWKCISQCIAHKLLSYL